MWVGLDGKVAGWVLFFPDSERCSFVGTPRCLDTVWLTLNHSQNSSGYTSSVQQRSSLYPLIPSQGRWRGHIPNQDWRPVKSKKCPDWARRGYGSTSTTRSERHGTAIFCVVLDSKSQGDAGDLGLTHRFNREPCDRLIYFLKAQRLSAFQVAWETGFASLPVFKWDPPGFLLDPQTWKEPWPGRLTAGNSLKHGVFSSHYRHSNLEPRGPRSAGNIWFWSTGNWKPLVNHKTLRFLSQKRLALGRMLQSVSFTLDCFNRPKIRRFIGEMTRFVCLNDQSSYAT